MTTQPAPALVSVDSADHRAAHGGVRAQLSDIATWCAAAVFAVGGLVLAGWCYWTCACPKCPVWRCSLACGADPRTRLVPVVILTSSKVKSDLTRGYSLGTSRHIRKPVDFQNFVTAVSQLGMYWLVLNELPANMNTPPA